MSEPLTRILAELPLADPDVTRTERTRMKCREMLARQAARAFALRESASSRRPVQVWQLLMAVLGVAYLAESILQALMVYGL